MSAPAIEPHPLRSWPPAARPWVGRMTWHDLLFAHWPLAPERLRRHVPGGLALDTFDGAAWLGVVPFRMTGVRPRLVPAIPGLSAFPEINLRTYVTAEGKPGVWFLSLDAASRLAVRAARAGWHLPYFHARMSCRRAGSEIRYRSERRHRGAPPAVFAARYRSLGPPAASAPGSLEAFLVERYCLYAEGRGGRLYRGDIHHPPWPLEPAEAEIERNGMAAAAGIDLSGPPVHLRFASRLEVVAWWLEEVGASLAPRSPA